MSELRGFRRDHAREQPILELEAGVWRGRAVVTPLSGLRGAMAARGRFEVSVSWTGPPMAEGFAPAEEVNATDLVMVNDEVLAMALAMAAIDELRALEPPDLRRLKRRLEEPAPGPE